MLDVGEALERVAQMQKLLGELDARGMAERRREEKEGWKGWGGDVLRSLKEM